MTVAEISLVVVGAQHPNIGKRGHPGPNRMFEILVSRPGEPVELRPEPNNPADRDAIAIYTSRGIQIGYVAADRTTLIHRAWHEAKEVRAIFQRATPDGGIVRVNLDGEEPSLPLPPDPVVAPDDGGWPEPGPSDDGVDWIPPDE
jgi:hypothetical protein